MESYSESFLGGQSLWLQAKIVQALVFLPVTVDGSTYIGAAVMELASRLRFKSYKNELDVCIWAWI